MPGELKNLDFELFCTFLGAIFSKPGNFFQLQKLKSELLEAESISGLFYRKVIGIYLLGKIADFIRRLIFVLKKSKRFFFGRFVGTSLYAATSRARCTFGTGDPRCIETPVPV